MKVFREWVAPIGSGLVAAATVWDKIEQGLRIAAIVVSIALPIWLNRKSLFGKGEKPTDKP